MRNLEERDIAYAGLGSNLAAALEPAYLDTTAGRVALVASCSTIPSHQAIAGEQRRDMGGRPGIAPLRHETRYVVPEESLEHVRHISEALGLEALKTERLTSSYPYYYPADGEDYYEFPNVDGSHIRFESGDEFRIDRLADEEDVEALLGQVRRATRQADWVIASHHAHESPGGRSGTQQCAAFVEEYAHRCIEAGADAFVGHGAHVLQGIEIYEGAPVFYDLGNFVAQNQLVTRFPPEIYERYGVDPDGYPVDIFDERVTDESGDPKGILANEQNWKSVLPVCEFDDGTLSEITLYPLDLLQETPRPGRGRPTVATGETADAILENLAEISTPYGTEISITDGKGRITV